MLDLIISEALTYLMGLVVVIVVVGGTIVYNQILRPIAKPYLKKIGLELAEVEVEQVAQRALKFSANHDDLKMNIYDKVATRLEKEGIKNIDAEELDEIIENILEDLGVSE